MTIIKIKDVIIKSKEKITIDSFCFNMKYISTRGGSQEYSFTEAFLSSYGPDNALFCPKEIPRISPEEMEKWSVGDVFYK